MRWTWRRQRTYTMLNLGSNTSMPCTTRYKSCSRSSTALCMRCQHTTIESMRWLHIKAHQDPTNQATISTAQASTSFHPQSCCWHPWALPPIHAVRHDAATRFYQSRKRRRGMHTGMVKAVWLSYWPTDPASPAISWNVDVMMKSAVCAAHGTTHLVGESSRTVCERHPQKCALYPYDNLDKPDRPTLSPVAPDVSSTRLLR